MQRTLDQLATDERSEQAFHRDRDRRVHFGGQAPDLEERVDDPAGRDDRIARVEELVDLLFQATNALVHRALTSSIVGELPETRSGLHCD